MLDAGATAAASLEASTAETASLGAGAGAGLLQAASAAADRIVNMTVFIDIEFSLTLAGVKPSQSHGVPISAYVNFNLVSNIWKRGSFRIGSRNGSVFRLARPASPTFSARFKAAKAWSIWPHWARISACW